MTTPHPASQVTHFNTCIDDLISVLKLPTVWGGHQPAPIVTALVEGLLVMLRQNFADSEKSSCFSSPSLDSEVIEAVRGQLSAAKPFGVSNCWRRHNNH